MARIYQYFSATSLVGSVVGHREPCLGETGFWSKGVPMSLHQVTNRLLVLFAGIIVMFNLMSMTPAAAMSDCPDMAAVQHQHHDKTHAPAGCCDGMQCCPLLPQPIIPTQVLRIEPIEPPALVIDTALLLIDLIDPPPRFETV